jgi:hypothetical protein
MGTRGCFSGDKAAGAWIWPFISIQYRENCGSIPSNIFIGWEDLASCPSLPKRTTVTPYGLVPGGAECTGNYEWCVGANSEVTLELILRYYPMQIMLNFPIVDLHNIWDLWGFQRQRKRES